MKYRNWNALVCMIALLLTLAVPVCAAEQTYIFDEADILTAEEEASLQSTAQLITANHDCGVYIVTLWDYTTCGSDVISAAENYYRSHGLGAGSGADGILLLLSMAERDYALIPWGNYGNRAFTDYGLDVLSECFLDDFGDDRWYAGFSDYLEGCDQLMEAARQGKPVGTDQKKNNELTQAILMILVIPAVIAGAVCGIMAFSMKTARQKNDADDYRQSLRLTGKQDRFITRTVRRERIESSSSSSSGRSSGKSGKF